MRLLLLSNSTEHGKAPLVHALPQLRETLRGVQTVAAILYAQRDHAPYLADAREALTSVGSSVTCLDAAADPLAVLAESDAVFVGGGNTFHLLARLHAEGLVSAVREHVRAGAPYVAASAGSTVACPTIKTCNSMPIVEPASFEALDLVPLQINPHFIDAAAAPRHMGETRAERIRQFHEEEITPVLGLREGSWLSIEGRSARLGGRDGGRLFRRGAEPVEIPSDESEIGHVLLGDLEVDATCS